MQGTGLGENGDGWLSLRLTSSKILTAPCTAVFYNIIFTWLVEVVVLHTREVIAGAVSPADASLSVLWQICVLSI